MSRLKCLSPYLILALINLSDLSSTPGVNTSCSRKTKVYYTSSTGYEMMHREGSCPPMTLLVFQVQDLEQQTEVIHTRSYRNGILSF